MPKQDSIDAIRSINLKINIVKERQIILINEGWKRSVSYTYNQNQVR